MYYKSIILLFLIFAIKEIMLLDIPDKNSANYGPYDLQVSSSEMCTGPRPKTIVTYKVTLYPHTLEYNMTFSEQARIDEVRISVFSIAASRKNLLYNLRVNQPCQHFVLGNLIDKFLNAKNCVVKKGNYCLSVDYTEFVGSYFGSSFFYGDFLFKTLSFSSNKNVLCNIVKAKFTKKQ